MSETPVVRHPESKSIVEFFVGRPIGFQVTHEDLRKAAGIPEGMEHQPTYAFAMVRAVQELAENYQTIVLNDYGVGYRVAHPMETIDEAKRLNVKARRQMANAEMFLACADRSKLSVEETTRLDDFHARQAGLHLLMTKASRAINAGRALTSKRLGITAKPEE